MWLTGPFAEVELRVCVGPRVGARVLDEDAALALLRPAVDAGSYPQLRALVYEAGLRTAALDDDELLWQTARLIARGDLDVIVHPRIPMVSEPIERIELGPPAVLQPTPLEAADHWIELAIQTADGTALPGMRCEITLPWGTVVTRTSDRLGLIRLEGLPAAGDCEVRLLAFTQQEPAEQAEHPQSGEREQWDQRLR